MKPLLFLIFFISIPAFADFSERLKQLEMERKINDIERKADWERREQRSRDYEERREKNQREIDEIINESNQTRFELDMQHRLNEINESR
jgi:hypothetical protein